jgi:lysozyme
MFDLQEWIKKDEGFQSHPYFDSRGIVTIGYGRNLDDNGISRDEALMMFENDIKKARNDLHDYSWCLQSPMNVQFALINMCFNMGINRLLKFEKMITHIIEKNYTMAAVEALNSEWAKQVGERAKEVALMMREGF